MTPWAARLPRAGLPVGHTPAAVQDRALRAARAGRHPLDADGPRRRPLHRRQRHGRRQSSFDGTLQALLTELSGLKKPRGFFNKYLRRTLGMRPKPPPKYRILLMMATQPARGARPGAAAPRPHRPALPGRLPEQGRPGAHVRGLPRQGEARAHAASRSSELAIMTPYHTGAKIKDTVNEALIYAIREDREVITWKDMSRRASSRSSGRPRTSSTSSGSGTPSPSTRPATRSLAWLHPAAHGDRPRDDREGQQLPRDGVQHPAGGPVHPVAHRVRERHHGQPRVAGRRAALLRRRQLLRRLGRPDARPRRSPA